MIKVPLTRGLIALIDSDDLPPVSMWKWSTSNFGLKRKPYARAFINGRSVYMHRFLMGVIEDSTTYVDHANGDTLDNRRSNLRLCTKAENVRNQGPRRDNLVGLKGVSRHKRSGLYYARIMADHKQIHLGYYKTAEDAAMAYDIASRELHKEFSYQNLSGDRR